MCPSARVQVVGSAAWRTTARRSRSSFGTREPYVIPMRRASVGTPRYGAQTSSRRPAPAHPGKPRGNPRGACSPGKRRSAARFKRALVDLRGRRPGSVHPSTGRSARHLLWCSPCLRQRRNTALERGPPQEDPRLCATLAHTEGQTLARRSCPIPTSLDRERTPTTSSPKGLARPAFRQQRREKQPFIRMTSTVAQKRNGLSSACANDPRVQSPSTITVPRSLHHRAQGGRRVAGTSRRRTPRARDETEELELARSKRAAPRGTPRTKKHLEHDQGI